MVKVTEAEEADHFWDPLSKTNLSMGSPYIYYFQIWLNKKLVHSFSVYIPFLPPIYKTNLGRCSPHIFTILRLKKKGFHRCWAFLPFWNTEILSNPHSPLWDTHSNNYHRNPHQKKGLLLIIHFSEWLKTKSISPSFGEFLSFLTKKKITWTTIWDTFM